ncbi:MAG: glutamate 5-kinase [Candidatus Dadabacteria bacterium]|nr:glutamate 5-kinase [Candidatus Dadabacteria bacterium]MCY4262724.1 glutamate 5-kinase [Candidatus Dadabacteria bacterium]
MSERERKNLIEKVKTAVVKIGSSVLTHGDGSLDESVFNEIAGQVFKLRHRGVRTIIVSSGAIASGMKKLGLLNKPEEVDLKQAISACGQTELIRKYEEAFSEFGMNVAQILLTREGFSDRKRFLNSRKTIRRLLEMEIIPVINENDTVAFEEIMFGDNDNLAALVISLTEADMLVLLSDVEGFFDNDPSKDENAKLLSMIVEIDSRIESFAGDTFGRTTSGGMRTKIQAAKSAAAFGVPTIIANGKRKDALLSIFSGMDYGTVILPTKERLKGRKHWIAYTLTPRGKLVLDEGATHAITKKGKSLLPSGIRKVEGEFGLGELVSCMDSSGVEISRGLCSYASSEIRKIMGKKSSEIESVLGYRYSDEIVHRNEMVIL